VCWSYRSFKVAPSVRSRQPLGPILSDKNGAVAGSPNPWRAEMGAAPVTWLDLA